jgi:folate-dependent phosphoribosylglycinamide formyltransferase PurN
MRLTICTKRDIFGCLILNWLLPKLTRHAVSVLLSDKTRPDEENVPELAELKLIERDIPLRLLFPLADQLPRTRSERLLSFDALTERHAVPVRTVAEINDGDGAEQLRAFGPDLILSARFSLIFKPPIIDLPRYGIYNIHPGALPRYGGLFAPMRGLLAGDRHLGCTLHRIDAGIDSGPIFSVEYLDVDPARSLFWHVARLYPLGLARFVEMLASMEQGREPDLQPQDRAGREYRSLPSPEDFAAFRAAGWALVKPEDYLDCLAGFTRSDV